MWRVAVVGGGGSAAKLAGVGAPIFEAKFSGAAIQIDVSSRGTFIGSDVTMIQVRRLGARRRTTWTKTRRVLEKQRHLDSAARGSAGISASLKPAVVGSQCVG
jgi:hypothetical protein